MVSSARISVVLPALNEAASLKDLLPKLKAQMPDAEIIVVNDGSTDDSRAICEANGVRTVNHAYPLGNGAAIKSGARAATGDYVVFMDADGQHDPADIPRLLERLDAGFDMVVGARDAASQASFARKVANGAYNRFASFVVGHPIPDLTSGFRAARTYRFREFLHMLPNSFSYPTTSTMAFYRSGYLVDFVPIRAHKRIGKSHIKLFKDGTRFFLIIFRIGTLFAPMKIFMPFSLAFFLIGLGWYGYTFATAGRFTNMSALLFMNAVMIFLIGLVSEQITNLLYSQKDR